MQARVKAMVRWVGLGLVLGLGLLADNRSVAQDNETLVFVVTGLRSDAGIVRGGIYASSDVWTTVGGQVATCTARPSGGSARCVIRAPGPGTYAFAFYHDADGDNRLDTDVVGIPQEAYGFSNNVRPGLGAPSFASASFAVGAGETYESRLEARYGWSL